MKVKPQISDLSLNACAGHVERKPDDKQGIRESALNSTSTVLIKSVRSDKSTVQHQTSNLK